jgi:hypothetical protein
MRKVGSDVIYSSVELSYEDCIFLITSFKYNFITKQSENKYRSVLQYEMDRAKPKYQNKNKQNSPTNSMQCLACSYGAWKYVFVH